MGRWFDGRSEDLRVYRAEFNDRFWPDIKRRWPSVDAWVKNGRLDTLRLWFDEVFTNLDLSECLEISKQVFRGDVSKWSHVEDMPAVYRSEVRRKAVRAREDELRRMETAHYLAVRKARREGLSRDDLLRLNTEFGERIERAARR